MKSPAEKWCLCQMPDTRLFYLILIKMHWATHRRFSPSCIYTHTLILPSVPNLSNILTPAKAIFLRLNRFLGVVLQRER